LISNVTKERGERGTYHIVNLGTSLRTNALEVAFGVGLGLAGEVALDIGSGSMGIACDGKETLATDD
jgi:hypothetical protein